MAHVKMKKTQSPPASGTEIAAGPQTHDEQIRQALLSVRALASVLARQAAGEDDASDRNASLAGSVAPETGSEPVISDAD